MKSERSSPRKSSRSPPRYYFERKISDRNSSYRGNVPDGREGRFSPKENRRFSKYSPGTPQPKIHQQSLELEGINRSPDIMVPWKDYNECVKKLRSTEEKISQIEKQLNDETSTRVKIESQLVDHLIEKQIQSNGTQQMQIDNQTLKQKNMELESKVSELTDSLRELKVINSRLEQMKKSKNSIPQVMNGNIAQILTEMNKKTDKIKELERLVVTQKEEHIRAESSFKTTLQQRDAEIQRLKQHLSKRKSPSPKPLRRGRGRGRREEPASPAPPTPKRYNRRSRSPGYNRDDRRRRYSRSPSPPPRRRGRMTNKDPVRLSVAVVTEGNWNGHCALLRDLGVLFIKDGYVFCKVCKRKMKGDTAKSVRSHWLSNNHHGNWVKFVDKRK